MPITAAGVGSGLDINGIVSQLMAIESEPLYKLQSKISDYNDQVSAYGKLKSALSTFQSSMEGLSSLDKIGVYSATASDSDIASVSVTNSASSGIYNLIVDRLAQNHKLASNNISSSDTFSGDLILNVDGTDFTVTTDGLTLEGIRDKVNSDASNPGITATIINTSSSTQKIIFTSDESGAAFEITPNEAAVSNTSGGAALGLTMINRDSSGVLLDSTAKLDASYSIDGIPLTAASNNLAGVLDGVTISLKSEGNSNIEITRDNEGVETSLKKFTEAYNVLYNTMKGFSEDELEGDTTIGSIQNLIRSAYNSGTTGLTGSFSTLSQIGITTDAQTGELVFDSTDFQEALDSDFNGVLDLFTNETQGYAVRLSTVADDLLDTNGFINAREDGIQSRIKYSENRALSLEAALELKETALRAKFAALDSLIGSMQSTMQFVSGLQ